MLAFTKSRIQQLTPILGNRYRKVMVPLRKSAVVMENWRQVHEQCLKLHNDSRRYNPWVLAAQRINKKPGLVDTTCLTSVFDIQQAFHPAANG